MVCDVGWKDKRKTRRVDWHARGAVDGGYGLRLYEKEFPPRDEIEEGRRSIFEL